MAKETQNWFDKQVERALYYEKLGGQRDGRKNEQEGLDVAASFVQHHLPWLVNAVQRTHDIQRNIQLLASVQQLQERSSPYPLKVLERFLAKGFSPLTVVHIKPSHEQDVPSLIMTWNPLTKRPLSIQLHAHPQIDSQTFDFTHDPDEIQTILLPSDRMTPEEIEQHLYRPAGSVSIDQQGILSINSLQENISYDYLGVDLNSFPGEPLYVWGTVTEQTR